MSIGELGLIFGKISSLGYASREGARVGAALALGDSSLCTPSNQDPSMVDASLVAAVQRILRSPDLGIAMNRIQQIRIFKADAAGREIGGLVNIWTYAGPGMGPEVDPGPGTRQHRLRASPDRVERLLPRQHGRLARFDRRHRQVHVRLRDAHAAASLDSLVGGKPQR